MIHSISANTRSDLRSATGASVSTVSSITMPRPWAQTAQDIRLDRLLFATRPPIDEASYTLPLKSVSDEGCFAELDARIAFLRKHGGAAPGEDIVQMVLEQHCRSLAVTREVVQDFYNDGVCPRDHAELKALSLFLLTNGLFDALTWLVAQSGADTLDLHRCNLGNDGAATVAEWARTLPLKVRLNLSNNRMEAAGVRLLAEALEADTIFALDLGMNPLGDEGVQLVCTGLAKNSSVRSLSLSNVGADSAGMEAVAGVLDTHPTLVSLNLDDNGYDDAAATVFATALGYNRTLRSLSILHADASDAGLSTVVGALRTNTALLTMRVSLNEPGHLQLPVVLAEVLAVNQTLSDLEVFFGIITNDAAEMLATAVARNTGLRTVECRLSAYGLTKENAAAVKRIKDKVKANEMIGAAGKAVSALSRSPESAVPVPSEVGQVIAAFVAQVADDQHRLAAMQAIVEAGRAGLKDVLA
jgi:hypothetical protein